MIAALKQEMHHPLPPPTLSLSASPHRAESCVAFKKGAAANLAIVHLVLATPMHLSR